MIRPILHAPDARLAEVCAPVETLPDGLIEDMFETMYAAHGRGLAAPQIGVMLRLFITDVGWTEGQMQPIVMINPVIEWVSEAQSVFEEACLSIPDFSRKLARPAQARFRWTDLAGAEHVAELDGIDATCAQHEMDHLDGRLITDHPQAQGEAHA